MSEATSGIPAYRCAHAGYGLINVALAQFAA
jgi:hypothetical protein